MLTSWKFHLPDRNRSENERQSLRAIIFIPALFYHAIAGLVYQDLRNLKIKYM